MTESGTWVYAVTHEAGPDVLAGVPGVAAEPLRTTGTHGLTAVVGTVPLATFGEQALRRNLEDIDWLATVARAHDAVVAAVARSAPAVPFRMATVYFDDARVRSLLAESADGFHAALSRVAGRSEWGVKVTLDVRRLTEPVPAGGGRGGTGTAYLQRRRQQNQARERADQLAVEHADEIHAALATHAVDACLHRPQSPALAGQALPMILNAAYLVDNGAVGEFTAAVGREDDRRHGVGLELTGPWPAYSFASIGPRP